MLEIKVVGTTTGEQEQEVWVVSHHFYLVDITPVQKGASQQPLVRVFC
jgi:hypothetical protein